MPNILDSSKVIWYNIVKMKGGEEVEWLKVAVMISGLILTLSKVIDTILDIIIKIKKLTTGNDSDEQ
ncbi:MAG: hypothetical protein AWU54_1472 [Candidatus Frackibacter sp. T328-2]|nr:MAG: hypothetical protein AWU54_1472 [Candidatus Frackibacter sp. T328-2]